jgi:hypothetical protein
MHLTKVHLFAILLLALVFCSFFSDNCSGSSLEGFSSNSPYSGNGNQYSNYGDRYSSNDKFAKAQDALHNRKDKPLDPNYSRVNNDKDSDDSKSYAPYNSGSDGQGIPGSQIPPGQDDLYILKSEIVPPVCPACPAMKCDAAAGSNGGGSGSGSGSGSENKCPPCPPCARCPEPAFECKKVPNYNSNNENAFPRPVLNSFSQFGM